VVKQGRDPALKLKRNGQEIGLREWANEILSEVAQIADFLDLICGHDEHTKATKAQIAKIERPELTPSARVLQRMREVKTSFFRFAMNQSLAASDYFRSLKLATVALNDFIAMSEESIIEQKEIEAADTLDFDTYLQEMNNR